MTLAIETSCDETAAAVLDSGGRVESSLLASQAGAHAPFGGVVPELASREHLRALPWLVGQCLEQAVSDPELVAVTAGPGLIGALLVGVRFASAFAWARQLPLVAVDHLEGHLVSPFLNLHGEPARALPPRILALVASGGHSGWYFIADGVAEPLGRTRDDAAGEAFDKVAQVLGLPYPGGPAVDCAARRGDSGAIPMPRPRLRDSTVDFSFSGLKSAAIRVIRDRGLTAEAKPAPGAVDDLLACFELAVVDHLLGPLAELVGRWQPTVVTASGGVAANTLLRSRLTQAATEFGIDVLLPPLELTGDNAAMIARAGQLAFARGVCHDPRRLDAHPRQAWQPPGMAKGCSMKKRVNR